MKLLYISYWGISDVLTKATVFPNLAILRPHCEAIYLATIERKKSSQPIIPYGVIHIPFYSFSSLPRFLEKASDFLFLSFKLFWLVKTKKIDLIICRGSMAAAFGVFLNKITSKPFIVESFEPHADYMEEGNTWRKSSPEYRLQKWVEEHTIRHAQYLLPVSENYRECLINQGVSSEKIYVMPCCVDIEKFKFEEEARIKIRTKLAIPEDRVVGIYVGKFGDIYLKDEAFAVFRRSIEVFENNFFLIILTPHSKTEIEEHLASVKFKNEFVHVGFVDHNSVPDFLSASDFAFSLIRPSASRKYCSPVKNGEYWANGLPILLTQDVGDDSQILKANQAGAILSLFPDNAIAALGEIKTLLKQGRSTLSRRITPLASRYRNFEIIAVGYAEIFAKIRNIELYRQNDK